MCDALIHRLNGYIGQLPRPPTFMLHEAHTKMPELLHFIIERWFTRLASMSRSSKRSLRKRFSRMFTCVYDDEMSCWGVSRPGQVTHAVGTLVDIVLGEIERGVSFSSCSPLPLVKFETFCLYVEFSDLLFIGKTSW
jgi:hypothetical protein